MKNRTLGLAVAAAALAGAMVPIYGGKAPMFGQSVSQQGGQRVTGGMTAPQGGIGSMLGAILDGRGSSSGSTRPPRFNKRTGWSCAEAKRRKRRFRNKLRAKGQFRKAVR